MSNVVDEKNNVFSTWTYDGKGRVLTNYLAGGVAQYSVTYGPVGSGSASVTDPLGTMRSLTYQDDGVYFYSNDHLGTPQILTDATGAVKWSADYEPFGAATVAPLSITNNLRFPGQYYDAETGLHQNGFRDYDPSIGRYLESDPIGLLGGINTYSYAEGNPVSKTDPTGEQAQAIPLGLGLLGAAAGCYATGTCQYFTSGLQKAVNKIGEMCKASTERNCSQEWEDAEDFCGKIAASNKFGSGKSVSGRNYQQCLMGQVSESCGGNVVSR